VVERLAPAFSEVVVSFGEPEQMEQLVPYRVVFDRKRAAGPLAGLEAGLLAARHEVLFAVACDMPYVTSSVAEVAVAAARSCDAAIPRHDGLFEPVCGAYRKTALPTIVGALDAGNYKPRTECFGRTDCAMNDQIVGRVHAARRLFIGERVGFEKPAHRDDQRPFETYWEHRMSEKLQWAERIIVYAKRIAERCRIGHRPARVDFASDGLGGGVHDRGGERHELLLRGQNGRVHCSGIESSEARARA